MKKKGKMDKDNRKIDIKEYSCRVCLNNDGANNNIYFVKIFYNKMKIYCCEMMSEIFSMSVYSGDRLPCNICRKCLRVLTAAYKLKMVAKESNRQLLLSLSSHSVKGKEEDKIKAEIPSTGCTAFENDIKEEGDYDSRSGGDYTVQDAGSNEGTDARRDGTDMEPHCSEDDTQWDKALSRDVVKSTGKPLKSKAVKEHKRVKRKYSMKAERPKRTSRLSASLVCEECGATFGCRNLADKHRRLVHLKEKRYFCDYCNKGYFERPRLVLHIKMHEGRRSFQCPNCSKAYFSRVGLSAHILAEAGERNFPCQLCPKKFWSKQMLTHHAITHSAVRPFPCRYCAVAYTRKAHRQRHELNVHAAPNTTEEEKGLKKTQVLVNKNT